LELKDQDPDNNAVNVLRELQEKRYELAENLKHLSLLQEKYIGDSEMQSTHVDLMKQEMKIELKRLQRQNFQTQKDYEYY
jgi:hypothetical protein